MRRSAINSTKSQHSAHTISRNDRECHYHLHLIAPTLAAAVWETVDGGEADGVEAEDEDWAEVEAGV